jgi:oxygen-independent coproporphyrinogen III oxidase
MLDPIQNKPIPAPQDPEAPIAAHKPELSRKGFITTYPMFRYWNKEAVDEGSQPRPLNVYVHMPYCIQRCAYCWFKTTTLKENRLAEIDRYVSSVCREIELASEHFDLKKRPVVSVYFGGGTPSLMTEDNIDRLFDTLRSNFTFADPQITFEGEPVTLSERKANCLKRNKVNRISLGIQSFKEEIVFQTGRQDTEKDAFRAIELAKSTGADVNIDLISGLAGETMESWAYSVQRAIESGAHNITVYKLELYANTPYYTAEKSQEISLPSEELELELMQYALGEFKKHDYQPCNSFTFTKGGAYDQKHTRSKWMGNDNCAVGVSAFGTIGRYNYQNLNDIPTYQETVESGRLPAFRGYNLTTFDLMLREVVMGIKLVHINHLRFREKHGLDLRKACSATLSQLAGDGFLTVDDETISLTEYGILYADYVGRALESSLKSYSGASAASRARVLF